MLGGPVWHELYVNHYPARPEAFLLPLLAGAVGVIVAVVSRVVGGLAGTITFGGLLFAFSDLQLDPQLWTYTGLVLAGCIGLAQLFVSHRAAISALALGAFYLSSLVRPAVAPPPTRLDTTGMARSTNPVLVHIVLDEQWGVGGLRAAGDSETADFLTDFYLTRGFELFESAYSHYLATEESLESVMLLGEARTDSVPFRKPYQHIVRRNPYFDRLHGLGYEIRVYQTTFIDFCNGDTAVVSCEVRLESSMGNFGFLDGSWVTRGVWLARYFLGTRSHIYARLFPGQTSWRRSAVGGGLAAGRHLTSAIGSHPKGGTAWFAHLLLPHRPVHVDEACRIQTDPSRQLPYYDLPDEHPADLPWRSTLIAYAGQVRCAHRVLAGVIDAIDRTVGRDHSIVIVHGDHGSRLHSHDTHDPDSPLEAYSSSELNAHFATLLAVRRPQVPATLHREPAPVQDVIWELARSGFTGALPETWPHYVSTMPDSTHANGQVRPLTASDMPWARRPD
jgi:hypothetical protein